MQALNPECGLQVPQDSTFLSCCLTVRGCQRQLFFVPRPGEIADENGTLARLEAAAAANPSCRGALMRHVHVGHPFSQLSQRNMSTGS